MNGYPTRPRGQGRIILASILIGAAIVTSCGAGLLGWKLGHDGSILAARKHQDAQDRAEFERDERVHELREQARMAAESVTIVMTSMDSSNIDKSFAETLENSTGELKSDFARASAELRQMMIDNKAASVGKVTASAVQSDTIDQPVTKVVVLLFVDQSITNMHRPDPRIDKTRMKMTMELIDGRWLASKLEYL